MTTENESPQEKVIDFQAPRIKSHVIEGECKTPAEKEIVDWILSLKPGDRTAVYFPSNIYPGAGEVVSVYQDHKAIVKKYPGAQLPDFSRSVGPYIEIMDGLFVDRTLTPVKFGSMQMDLSLHGVRISPWSDAMEVVRCKRGALELIDEFNWAMLPLRSLQAILAIIQDGLSN